jgi:ABC-type sulfate transport system permease component
MQNNAPTPARRRFGLALIVVGLLTIVVSVIVVLEIANGPGTGPKTFAERRSYDQVKVDVQRSFPIALIGGLFGLGVAILGARIRRGPDEAPP